MQTKQMFDDPVTLYRGGVTDTRVVHSQKQYDDAVKDGYGPYSPSDYPRLVYNQTMGNGNPRTKKAVSVEHEAELAKEGYGRQPVAAPPETPQPIPVVSGGTPDGRIASLEARVLALETMLALAGDAEPRKRRA